MSKNIYTPKQPSQLKADFSAEDAQILSILSQHPQTITTELERRDQEILLRLELQLGAECAAICLKRLDESQKLLDFTPTEEACTRLCTQRAKQIISLTNNFFADTFDAAFVARNL
jgi:hypothetical protein